MNFRLPVRRFLQGTEKTETPQTRFGTVQWVLSRPMYRFQTFDLAQVPAKNRPQALQLELAQWTPFTHSDYYVGWHKQQVLVWAWDASKVQLAITAQGHKPHRVRILPESILQTPVDNGLALCCCHEGYEGQRWRAGQLSDSRWWAHLPTQQEWLMFQRDTGLPASEQQHQPPSPQVHTLNPKPWLKESAAGINQQIQAEKLILSLCILCLLTPTLWYGFSLYKTQHSTTQLEKRLTRLQSKAEPIIKARNLALDTLARINTLRAHSVYPEQLLLMAKISNTLPDDNSYVQAWNFQQGQLKINIYTTANLSISKVISSLQQTGYFKNIQVSPGHDSKHAQFKMSVLANHD